METLFTHDIRRHVPGYMELMKTKYPSIKHKDYFEKIAVSANYTSYPPVMDVVSFEDIRGAEEAESLTLCNRNIQKVLDSHGNLGLMRTTFQEGEFTGIYHQIFPLKWALAMTMFYTITGSNYRLPYDEKPAYEMWPGVQLLRWLRDGTHSTRSSYRAG